MMNTVVKIIAEHGDTKESVVKITELENCSMREAGEKITPHVTKARDIYSTRTGKVSGVALSNRRVASSVRFCVTNETRDMFASDHDCFMYLWQGYQDGLLPKSGRGEGKPLTPRAIELYERNKAIGVRHWVWISEQPGRHVCGYDAVWGYGYRTNNGFVIVNNDDTVFVEVQNSTA